MRIRSMVVCTVALGSVACGGGLDLPAPGLIEVVGNSNNQIAVAGDRLSRPLVVRVTTSDGAIVVPRAEVRWQVTEGSGASLSDSVTVADGVGEAHVTVQLGPEPGNYMIRASLVAKTSQTASFTALASRPPRAVSVEPTTFGAGDTITVRGTGLTGAVRVEVEGRSAVVVGRSVTETALSVVVPWCLLPGPVMVAARVGLASSVLVATYVSDDEVLALAPGDAVSVGTFAVSDCARFPAAGSEGAEYLLAPQSVSGSPGVSVPFRLTGNAAVTAVTASGPAATTRPIALAFHDFLRAQDAALARAPRAPYSPEGVLAVNRAGIEVGQRREFKVCNSVTCSAAEDFSTVRAEAKYVGRHAAVYVDLDAPSGGLSATDFTSLGELFDRDLYEVATTAFGAESDVDRNGLVFILLTPVVNGLTPVEQCPTSFITGFFFSLDTDPDRVSDPRSNQAEIFYGIVPDPNGSVTCQHSIDRVRRIVPITFVHEIQHLINFYQRTVLRGGEELTWLNEAMSHLAEELGAHHFRAKNDSVRFSAFATGNLFNAYQYLSAPEMHFPIFGEGSGTLAERGAGWLFLRWVVDQFGVSVIRRLSETGRAGFANVERATGEPFATLLSDWFLANYLSDHPGFPTPPRLQYTTWDFRDVYQSLHAQAPEQFARPFPIEPRLFVGGTFDVLGTLRAGSGDYLRVELPANALGFGVRLVDGIGNPLSGPSVPRLQVARVR